MEYWSSDTGSAARPSGWRASASADDEPDAEIIDLMTERRDRAV